MSTTAQVGAESAGEEAGDKRDAQELRTRHREESLSVGLTSVAALATAWSAFQSATWGGTQTFALARTARLRQQAVEARLEGDQLMHLDADLFLAYAEAYSEHREGYASFLLARFPPRLKKATDAWLAKHPLEAPSGPPHPFAMAEYEVEAFKRADALNEDADAATTAGERANYTADGYVLGTVILASVMLLASMGPRLASRAARRSMLGFSTVVLIAALVWLAVRPIAWIGAHH